MTSAKTLEDSNMARKYLTLNVLFIILLLMTSCHMSDSSDTSAPSLTADEASSSEHVPLEDDHTPKLIWAVSRFAFISEETQAEIQRFLDEKGINCRIEFTPLLDQGGQAYAKWLDERKKEGTTPDILSGCFWEHGIVDLVSFVQKELLPLNSYLETEEGKKLYNSYAEVEWNRTAINGVFYSIPYRIRQYKNSQGRFFLCVGDQYKSFFDEWYDGTYASLRKVIDAIPDLPKIAVVPNFDIYHAYSFFQTQAVFSAPYCWERNEIIDLTRENDFKELLLDIYEDYQRGMLIDIETAEQVNGYACAYIGFSGEVDGYYNIPEGYTEYVLAPERYLSSPGGGAYGISAFSEKQDLAFQVLSACYSDPKIASLIFWRVADEDRWNERTQFLKTCVPSSLNNFIPDITPEEFSMLKTYDNDLGNLGRELYQAHGESRALNPNFPDVVDQFFSSPKDYGPILEKVNDQIQRWIDKKQ